MKYYLFFFLLAIHALQAQSIERHYFKENGEETLNPEIAQFFRDYSIKDHKVFHFVQYAMNGMKECEGDTPLITPLIREGKYIVYDTNQTIREETEYRNGQPEGLQKKYYSNRKLEEVGYWVKDSNSVDEKGRYATSYQIESYFDTKGKLVVEKGTGPCSRWNEAEELIEEGVYLNGLKDGVWEGYPSEQSIIFYNEIYEKGVLTQGISYDALAQPYRYKKLDEVAVFTGKEKTLEAFLRRAFTKSLTIRTRSFRGEILVSCVVNTKGNITEVQVPSLRDRYVREEIIRIMNRMNGKWQASKHRGQLTTTQLHIPIRL